METIQFPDNINLQDNELEGRIILITGAGGGFGSAMAKAFAKQGATIILLDKYVRSLENLYDEIEALGAPKPAIYPLDLSGASATDFEELAKNIEKEFGQLDGLLHCAAMLGMPTPFELSDIETWYKVMQVNLNGPYMLTRMCIPLLKQSESGRIAFSVDNKNGAYWDAYGVSKSALIGLTAQLAKEYEDGELKVNAINPGQTSTHLHMSAYPAGDYTHLYDIADHIKDYTYLMSKQLKETGVLFSKVKVN
ncbi:MAG: SDR family NAD(P)-dependent oxidoreductase [Gammaproteobacteria bacterium]|nr:SDR family NAD(P)-dependent oxidoreductase [Gammaproteobacteria bacterium]